jgi:hypothetical protein
LWRRPKPKLGCGAKERRTSNEMGKMNMGGDYVRI